jgi:hypothetical protein
MRLALLAILAMAATVHAAPAPVGQLDDDDQPIVAQLIIGATVGVLAMGAGASIGQATEKQLGHCKGGFLDCGEGVVLGAIAAAPLGVGAGIAMVGNSNRARGSYAAAIGGSMAGTLVALGGALALESTVVTSPSDTQIAVAFLSTSLLVGGCLGGGLLGYNLTRHSITQDVVLVPVVQPGGGGLTFAGRF